MIREFRRLGPRVEPAGLLAHYLTPNMTVQDVGGVVSLSVTLVRYVEGYYNFDIGPRSVVIDAVVRYLAHEESEYNNDCVMGSEEVDWKAWVKCSSIHTLRRTS